MEKFLSQFSMQQVVDFKNKEGARPLVYVEGTKSVAHTLGVLSAAGVLSCPVVDGNQQVLGLVSLWDLVTGKLSSSLILMYLSGELPRFLV